MAAPHPDKLAIIAGSGALPGLLIAARRNAGLPYYVVGLQGFATVSELGQEPDLWLRFGEAGKGFELLRKASVTHVVMAGAVKRPSFADLKPDLKTASFFARIAGKALGDDGLLSAVISEVESEGFQVVGADEILSALLAPHGVLGAHKPDAQSLTDIAVGAAAARDLGQRDLGQAVVALDGVVTAREDETGTDALIARVSGGVLVKMKKPQQERRIDLPTIGVNTVRNAAARGFKGIAVEAGHTLVIDQASVIAAANELGLFVIGVTGEQLGLPALPTLPLIYVVAAEPSGDHIGALFIKALKDETHGQVRIAGIGGPAMARVGLRSLFNPAELALLGIFEVIPKVRMVLRRVAQTVADIEKKNPAVLVTIDSWGFTGRIHERLAKKRSPIKRIRYVAPQVWAWRPGRAKQLARWIQHLMTLFPFEPPYFTKYGLDTSWVGHPVLESGADKGDGAKFKQAHDIAGTDTLITVLPGSRGGEVSRLLGVFGETVKALAQQIPNLRIVVPTVPNVEARVRAAVATWPGRPIVVTTEHYDAFAASRAALAASGTVSLELAMAGLPHLIAYKVNALSAFAFRLLANTKFVNLVNILLGRVAVPERLQEDCNVSVLTADLLKLINDENYRSAQKADFKTALSKLAPEGLTPSRQAARKVLEFVIKR
jgi:lipid-A-disaccharide synthase